MGSVSILRRAEYLRFGDVWVMVFLDVFYERRSEDLRFIFPVDFLSYVLTLYRKM